MTDTNTFYLIEESLGKQWYFLLSEKHTIEFTWRDKDSWAKPVQLDEQPIKRFKVTIDMNDRIHILAYSTSKRLIYYEWNGNQWYHRMLFRVQSQFENISKFDILSALNSIHVFYYIENALKRAQEYLVHARLENGKWHSNEILNFLTDQGVKLQLIQHDSKGNLFGIYTRLLRNETRCYFVYYNNQHGSWSKPYILFQQQGICSNFNGCADSNGDFHLLWVEKSGIESRLNYKKIIPTILNLNTEISCIQDNTAMPIDITYLHIDGNVLYCCWIQDERAFVNSSNISEVCWGQSKEIAKGPFHIYKKVSKSLDGYSRIETKIGDGYPEFSWTLESLLLNNQTKEKVSINKEQVQKEKKNETLFFSLEEIQQTMNKLESKVKEINSRMDDFHAALYQLQDYIRQKDKNSFQREAQIRKLAFEIEQIRSMRTNIPTINLANNEIDYENNNVAEDLSSPVQNNELPQKEKLPKNVDLGSGEIQLGNVSILINPEEESENNN